MRIFRSDGEFTTPISSFAISTIELVLNNGTTENEFLRQDLQARVPKYYTNSTSAIFSIYLFAPCFSLQIDYRVSFQAMFGCRCHLSERRSLFPILS